MNDCLFCKIIAKSIPADIVFEDEEFIVFKDINPKAKLHLLTVPKEHITSLAHVQEQHKDLLGKALFNLHRIAKQHGAEAGFRTIINTGKGGGQEVDHLHIHLLAGNLRSF
ncbi:MAG: histidine triad nucleotide-binding protein [Gammaproteobacteria bacterium]|nr:histidine triad nucleotide-binding protein [Gammaproteobacteria bacterium]